MKHHRTAWRLVAAGAAAFLTAGFTVAGTGTAAQADGDPPHRPTSTTIGLHEDRPAGKTVDRSPGAKYGREFIGGKIAPRKVSRDFEILSAPWLKEGGGAYISFKPKLKDVSAGRWKAHLRDLGRWLQQHPTVKVIVNHEPENDMSGKDFRALFGQARDQIKEGWSGATVAYAAMAYQWRKGGISDRNEWAQVPADEYLVDVYSGKSFHEKATMFQHDGFKRWFDAIVQERANAGQRVKWGVSERGWQARQSPARAEAISNERSSLVVLSRRYHTGLSKVPPPVTYLIWNTPGTENDRRWVLDRRAEHAANRLLREIR